MSIGPKMAEIRVNSRKSVHFNFYVIYKFQTIIITKDWVNNQELSEIIFFNGFSFYLAALLFSEHNLLVLLISILIKH